MYYYHGCCYSFKSCLQGPTYVSCSLLATESLAVKRTDVVLAL